MAMAKSFQEDAAPAAARCWRCAGTGVVARPPPTAPAPCGICGGSGHLARKRRRADGPRPEKQFEAFIGVGPAPPPETSSSSSSSPSPSTTERRSGEELNYLCGRHRIFQSVDTHKYSTDDVVTAWVAWRAGLALLGRDSDGGVRLHCDIGCGIGSVLLMTRWLHPGARACVGIEAQPRRAAMARRSAAYNGVGGRVGVCDGDLRNPLVWVAAAAAAGLLAQGEGEDGRSGGASCSDDRRSDAAGKTASASAVFNLVTGTPPYFDLAEGGARPPDEEAARCLFEYRGGIEAYCAAAAGLLAPPPQRALFVVCASGLALARSYMGARSAGLRVLARVDCVPREGKPPLFCVFVMCLESAAALFEPAAAASPFGPLDAALLPYDDMRTEQYDAALRASLERGAAASAAAAAARAAADAAAAAADAPPHTRKQKPRQAARGLHVELAGRPAGVRLGSQTRDELFVHTVTVRQADGERPPEYRRLLWEMGKPS